MSPNISGNILKHSGMLPNILGSVLNHSWECCQTFRGMLPSIPRNIAKHSRECPQTFWGMSPDIPRNVAKHSGDCPRTFWGISPNIPGNVTKHSGACRQTFSRMSPSIPGNVPKHSGECRQTFRGISPNQEYRNGERNEENAGNGGNAIFQGMSSNILRNVLNIPGNVAKHSRECCHTYWGISPMFGVNEENYWAESQLESCQTFRMELFCENTQRP